MPCSDVESEKRFDIDSHRLVTLSELRREYQDQYDQADIEDYWHSCCVELPRARGCGATGGRQIADLEAGSQLRLSECLLRAGLVEEAKDVCRQLERADPSNVDVLVFLAFCHDLCHETDSVEHWANLAVRADPAHPRAWLLLGMTRSKQGRFAEAIEAYNRASGADPGGNLGDYAIALIGNLQKNLDCVLQEVDGWAESAEWIVAQEPREQPVHFNAASEQFALRWCLSQHVLVFDNVLAPELLNACLDSVDDLCSFGLRNPALMNTYWLASGIAPKTAAEVVGLVLCRHILGREPGDFSGFKWWCKNQPASMGAHFHYDCNFQLHRPTYSLVLYLSDLGGPTAILDQYADVHDFRWPQMPQIGYLVAPKLNRCAVFAGELRHGMYAVDHEAAPRYCLLYNFFDTYTVPPPHCQVPDFRSYGAVSAWAPTRRHLLPPDRCRQLEEAEECRARQRIGPLHPTVLSSPEHMEHSSYLGDLPCAYPLPTATKSRAGGPERGFYKLLWRKAAEVYLSCL